QLERSQFRTSTRKRLNRGCRVWQRVAVGPACTRRWWAPPTKDQAPERDGQRRRPCCVEQLNEELASVGRGCRRRAMSSRVAETIGEPAERETQSEAA